MKISTSANHGIAAGLSVRQSIVTMKRSGFEGIDWALSADSTEPEKLLTRAWTDRVLEVAHIAREEGLELAQSHLPYGPGHTDNPGDGSAKAYGEVWLPRYEHALEACALGGCTLAVVHPMYMLEGYEQTVEANLYLIDKLMPLLKQTGIRLAVENVFARRNKQYLSAFVAEARTIAAIVDGVNSPLVGACMDTGHVNIFRKDISEFARELGSRLIALHVNSNAGEDEHLIPYTAAGWCERMDFGAFTKTLNEIGYKGWYNLEITGGRFPAEAARPFYEYAAIVAKWLTNRLD
ncbi:MAG: sugar phosphate isomerase/epimerase [Clostridia bacterium]|nr:sugar phosphate isomerase/epimerase [Clostridia bacterium]